MQHFTWVRLKFDLTDICMSLVHLFILDLI